MADGFDNDEAQGTGEDDWSIDELLADFDDDPAAQEAESKADEDKLKLAKGQRKLAEKISRMEEKARIEKTLSEFYAAASDTEKEVADVLLAGVNDEARVKKMVDLAKAKAKAMEPEDEEAEAKATEDAFAAPPPSGPAQVEDEWAPIREAARKGDTHASFLEFFAAPGPGKGAPKR